MSAEIEAATAWLTASELQAARQRLPIVYLNLVPVRLDANARVSHVGLLLRATPDGDLTRSIITGRVHYGELILDAILRHVEKDLGPVCLPVMPTSTVPFGVFEYFPDANVTGLRDSRQHAVALGYVIPVNGDCRPSQEALDLVWISVADANNGRLDLEMTDGHSRVVRAALAYTGSLS